MQFRYLAWVGFAIVAIVYSVADSIKRQRDERWTLLARLEPFKKAFRTQYVTEEYTEREHDDT